ncbi:hypothetical protein K8Z61_09355 [Nocardioides sp. TRM66260-LWL]|uniref:hypothetical protein n=1 Tax=Nocardioides sp. TRM66260-LWL TaxID=2874478 RepID=UPI001CC46750|nr:hypothetical protein [Nocardioides sp. TRM66260-LWL]MBZ5734701.1 hypothetical protein [Nocardioides sp. TRM66260-LWL]
MTDSPRVRRRTRPAGSHRAATRRSPAGRGLVAASAVLVLSGVAGVAYAAGASSSELSQPRRTVATDSGAIVVRSCVLRWQRSADGTKAEPYLYTNQAHPCPGLTGVSTNADTGDVVITGDTASFGPILYVAASPDETFARMGMIVGASAGNTLVLRLSLAAKAVRGDDLSLAQPNANLWLLVVSSTTPGPTPSTAGVTPTPSPSVSTVPSATPTPTPTPVPSTSPRPTSPTPTPGPTPGPTPSPSASPSKLLGIF